MEIERAQLRHLPHHDRQHPESHHDEEVGLIGCQLLQKRRVFQLFGLKQRQIVFQCSFLNLGILYLPATTSGLVGHGDDGSDIIVSREDGFELRGGKFWCAEIYDSDFVHVCEGIKKLA